MRKLLFVLMDGLRTDALEAAHTPAVDQLIQHGSYWPDVQSVVPPLTLPAHFSIFSSQAPYSHGVTCNTAHPNASAHTANLFHLVKLHQGRTAAFYSWEHLRNLGPADSLDHSYYLRIKNKADLMELARSALSHLESRRPDFCFVYLEWTDIVGHEKGWMSGEYLQAVEDCDEALSLFLPLLTNDPAPYTLVLGSDHGGEGSHHQSPSPNVSRVPLAMAGPGISQGTPPAHPVSLLDIAPTLAACMGIRPHFAWEGNPLV